MAKRRFRKVYIVCENNKIFGDHNYQVIEIFRIKQSAENVCKHEQQKAIEDQKQWSNQNQPISTFSVHGFYLIHEDYFKEEGDI